MHRVEKLMKTVFTPFAQQDRNPGSSHCKQDAMTTWEAMSNWRKKGKITWTELPIDPAGLNGIIGVKKSSQALWLSEEQKLLIYRYFGAAALKIQIVLFKKIIKLN